MATTNGGQPQDQPQGPQGQQGPQPQLNVLAQYIKDLSFENPNAPRSLKQQGQQPAINIQINVTPKQLSTNEFEVELKLEGKAELDNSVMFSFELTYAGVFRLQNIAQENVGPVVMIECPRLLFPFARELIAGAVTAGGYPPLMLDPVDFVALYRQKMSQVQPQAATATPTA
jgi:preprotein translocase subunit SecB